MTFHHIKNPHPHKPQADLSQFYVITVISNPWRYKRRFELYWQFKEMCEHARINLITVEQTFGHRPFMVTEANNPMHLQVRTTDELWHKENMINMGISHACALFPGKVKEVAWVDADCFPLSYPAREWFEETWHALQHYEFVQMWKSLVNMGPNNEVVGIPQPSFMYSYEQFGFEAPSGNYKNNCQPDYASDVPNSLGRPGLAWAANIDALNKVGGLIDFCILGSGDWHMAHAVIGAMTEQTTLVGTLKGHGSQEYAMPNYTHALLDWQEKCERWIKRDVGYVNTTLGHRWHGKYRDRKYGSRGKILIQNGYNPYTDIKYDAQGLLQLETWEPRQIKLRDQIRHYFATRAEDSIDL